MQLTNLIRHACAITILVLACHGSVKAEAPKPSPAPRFHVLAFYSANWDAAHISFANEANVWLPKAAEAHGFSYEATKDWTRLNPKDLSRYQVVLFLDDQPPKAQREAFQAYMDKGGAWMGFHVVAFNQDPKEWSWYYHDFLGCDAYKGNTWAPTSAVLKVEASSHPALRGLGATFKTAPNEWYRWTGDLRGRKDIQVLCSIDPVSFPLGTGPKPHEIWHGGDYPVVWTNTRYRMIYLNMGHNQMDYEHNLTLSWTFQCEPQNQLVLNALEWLTVK